MKRSTASGLAAATIAATLLAGGANAHEGHDHAEAPPPNIELAPRASAQTADFELVAVREDGRLLVYLDRFGSNEPVADAQVEIDDGAATTAATQVAPGVYALSGVRFAAPGAHPLTISVQSANTADLLVTTLEVPAPAPTQGVAAFGLAASATDWLAATPAAWWAAPAAIALAGVGLFVARRRGRVGGRAARD